MLGDCDIKDDAATTRSNNHKCLYSSFVSNAFAGGSSFMQQFLLKLSKLATVELHSCILLLSFHSACYLSNSGGFHPIKATKGRSLGGVAYIWCSVDQPPPLPPPMVEV